MPRQGSIAREQRRDVMLATSGADIAGPAGEGNADAVAPELRHDTTRETVGTNEATGSRPELDDLSVDELRGLIAQAGLSADDCLEKSELRERAREAVARSDTVRVGGQAARNPPTQPVPEAAGDPAERFAPESDHNQHPVVTYLVVALIGLSAARGAACS